MARHIVPLTVLGLIVLVSACTIVRVDSDSDPARIETRGLIQGHAAVGVPAEDHILHVDLFDGTSNGAIAEIVVWKLFRFELGLAGASIGVGPFSLGLGIFFYDAETPKMKSKKREFTEVHSGADSRTGTDDGVTEASAHEEGAPSD